MNGGFRYPRPSHSWGDRIVLWVALPVMAGVLALFAAALVWQML